jgi:integrase
MKTSDLREDKEITDWFSGLKASANTKQAYFQALQSYTDWTGKTPLELLEEAEAEVRAGKLMRERKIRSYLTQFREYLDSQELAPLTVKSRMTGVLSFYKYNNIDLPVIPKSALKAKPQQKRREIPTKEDIRHILNFADPLEKSLVLVGVSSGLSITEISNLKIKDFMDGLDEETGITTLNLVRQKVNYSFTTFLSPEATKVVQAYLDWRNREAKTENKTQQKQLLKQKVTSKDGYLFINRVISDEYLTTKKEKDKEKLRKLTPVAIMGIYRRLNEEAGKSAPNGEYNLVRSHNFRRFFNSALLNAGAQQFVVDYFLGHTLDSTHDAYYRSNPNELKKIYSQYIPYITVAKALDISESPEYQEIKRENQILQAETAKHVVERSELQDLREQLEIANSDRIELEKNIDLIIQEKMAQALKELDESMERLRNNMKQLPFEGL